MAGRDEILKIIRSKGPVLPVQVSKEIGTSILFGSAMLSELVSAKFLKVSTVKIGGSPLYYLPEHAPRLQDFSKHLPQKEREAYAILKEKKVLRESAQEPAIKVALKNLKDFAWPLQVTVNNSKEIFWRWYLLSNEDAGSMIKDALGLNGAVPAEEKEAVQPEAKENIAEKEKAAEEKETKPEEKKGEELKKAEEKQELAVSPRTEKHPIQQKEAQQRLEPLKGQNIKKETPPIPQEKQNGSFLLQILGYFQKNSIKVIEQEIVRKNSEIDFVVLLQSAVGGLRYYCKAKAKKKVGDGDFSTAYVQGELRKLPVLFLSPGEPTKRANEMLNNEFKNIVFKKINGG